MESALLAKMCIELVLPLLDFEKNNALNKHCLQKKCIELSITFILVKQNHTEL